MKFGICLEHIEHVIQRLNFQNINSLTSYWIV